MLLTVSRMRVLFSAAVAGGLTSGLLLLAPAASAASASVTMACASDYLAYCSKHPTEGPGVRQCMRSNGSRLSQRCVEALIAAGEVSRAEVKRREASAR
jgi:hypothetical protein